MKMADPPKKLTFGFSKTAKKSSLSRKEKPSNVQFIDCLEGKTIKVRDGEENKIDAPLVIPIIGPRKSSTIVNGKSIAETAEDFSSVTHVKPISSLTTTLGTPQNNGHTDSLEVQAAREILQEASDMKVAEEIKKLDLLPSLDSKEKEEIQKESTLEDYENIPVTQFGLAMLRGMGWKEDEGIGKNKKIVSVAAPQVRPKGMGLGADKAALGNSAAGSNAHSQTGDEELKLTKGAFVKVLGGSYRNQYGQVEGFDDNSGRVILKMAIGGNQATVNEVAVQLVSKSEYIKNSKVLNAAKYDEFKGREEKAKTDETKERVQRELPPTRKIKEEPTTRMKTTKLVYSPEGRKSSVSPSPQRRKERSSGDERHIRGTLPNTKSRRSQSVSPHRKGRRSRSPTPDNRRLMKSPERRRVPESPIRSHRKLSPSSSKRRSRSHSRSKRKKPSKKRYSSSSSLNSSSPHSSSPKKKKNKKKYKDSSSDSVDSARSRSITPKRKRKGKKSRRSRSRSPSYRKRR